MDEQVLELVVVAQWREAVVLLEEWDRLRGSEGSVGLLVGKGLAETEVTGSGFVAEDAGALQSGQLLIDGKRSLEGQRSWSGVHVERLEGLQRKQLLLGQLGRGRRDNWELLGGRTDRFDLLDNGVGLGLVVWLEVDRFLEWKLLFHRNWDRFAGQGNTWDELDGGGVAGKLKVELRLRWRWNLLLLELLMLLQVGKLLMLEGLLRILLLREL